MHESNKQKCISQPKLKFTHYHQMHMPYYNAISLFVFFFFLLFVRIKSCTIFHYSEWLFHFSKTNFFVLIFWCTVLCVIVSPTPLYFGVALTCSINLEYSCNNHLLEFVVSFFYINKSGKKRLKIKEKKQHQRLW